MLASDVPNIAGYTRRVLSLGELLARARRDRAGWQDLPDEPGIYVVLFATNQPLHFVPRSTTVLYADPTSCEELQSKWTRICQKAPTDIIYIGKGDSIRKRVRILARFGVGRAGNHHGGEWMWQVQEIAEARVVIQTCPAGKQVGFENWLLKRFYEEHGDYPLANRAGPQGNVLWSL